MSDNSEGNRPELILIGTGSEVELCEDAAEKLRADGKKVRVVSMPCWKLYEEQDLAYKESVLPKAVKKRLVVEAMSSFGWAKYFGDEGDMISVDGFGASAPGGIVMEKFGYTIDNVVDRANALLS